MADIRYTSTENYDLLSYMPNGESNLKSVQNKLENILQRISMNMDKKEVILDLSDLHPITSPELRVLIKYHKFLNGKGKTLNIVANPESQKYLYSTPFVKEANLFKSFDDFENKQYYTPFLDRLSKSVSSFSMNLQ